MQIKHLDIPGVGSVPVNLPQSYAARLDLLSAWNADDADRGRLMWALIGTCWAGKRLPAYRPRRGDRDLYSYAAEVCDMMIGGWGLSPSTPVRVWSVEDEAVTLRTADGAEIPLTLWTVGAVLMQQITASIPRAEVVEQAANFTSQSGAA